MRSAATAPPDFVRQTTSLPLDLAKDVADITEMASIQGMLELLCHTTGLGFAAVSRVTADSWTACAVHDTMGFGIGKGGQVDVTTTPAQHIRSTREPVAFDHATNDPVYRHHAFPRLFGIESYVSVPIVLTSGEYFGNLGALDARPMHVANPETIRLFQTMALLIGQHLDMTRKLEAATTRLNSVRQESVLREQFIGVLAHDLRSPLSAITALSYSMVRRPETVDVAAIGGRLKASVGRMAALVEDVLDFSRGRLGQGLTLNLQQDENLGAVLEDVIHETRSAHPDRVLEADIDLCVETNYDKTKLQQLLANLLTNAIQHGEPTVPVIVRASAVEGLVQVSVSNIGPTIDPAHLERIFEPYWRSPASPSKGLGLGLHICSQVAAAHGGRMLVSSTTEGWTTFTAELPLLS